MFKKLISGFVAMTVAIGGMSLIGQAKMMVDISFSASKLVALKEDGTIKIHGYDLFDNSVVDAYNDIKQVAVEDFKENSFFVLKNDGTVDVVSKFVREDFSGLKSWENIIEIDAGNSIIAGLTADGTVKICGANSSYYTSVNSWENVISIYAKEDAVIGITSEGKVLVAGVRAKGTEVKDWNNMKKVVYDNRCFWGITNDGNIITTDNKFKSVDLRGAELLYDITDIEAMSAYAGSGVYSRVLALRADGTLIDISNHLTRYGSYNAEVLYEDVDCVVTGSENYAFVLKDGEIISDKKLLSSEEWILNIDIRVNGKYVDQDVPAYIKNGRTMVPIRAIAEALGAEVGYDDATKTAIINKNGTDIRITMDSDTAYVDGKPVTLQAAAENVNGRIFVPVRFVSEGLGAKVDWYGDTKSVIITTN